MNLNTVLEKWDDAKMKKKYYEDECESYKEAVNEYLNSKNLDEISSSDYIVRRKSYEYTHLPKAKLPPEIVRKYSEVKKSTRYTLCKKSSRVIS